jgi:manganese/zinc/iron transport system substrate-binding protein
VPAIFVESTVSDRYLRALQEAVAADGHRVAIGGQLYSDALGEAGSPSGTYLGMLRHNVDTIVAALTP